MSAIFLFIFFFNENHFKNETKQKAAKFNSSISLIYVECYEVMVLSYMVWRWGKKQDNCFGLVEKFKEFCI